MRLVFMLFSLKNSAYIPSQPFRASSSLRNARPSPEAARHLHRAIGHSAINTDDGQIRAMTKYEETVRRLYQVNMWSPVKIGLENSEILHRLIGFPMTNKPIVHVAGTNGKGSVAWKISRALREAGYRDGLFVSPHIASFRERIQICGEMISEDDVVASLPWIFELCRKHSVAATFFELTTALAFHHFKSADVVVLEVGLGGRLDATNVVTPTVSVITSIGLDHTRVLGDTVEDIALEKAGVMKPRVPVVVGPRVPIEVLEAKASEVGSPLHRVDFGNDESENGPIFKDFDAENTEIARSTLNILCGLPGFERLNKRCIDVGVATRPPCRFEELAVSWDAAKRPAQWASVGCNESVGTATRVILDVGHNPPALTQLLSRLASSFPTQPLRFVLGMSRDKDVGECVRLILESLPNLRVSHIHFVAAKHPRAAPPSTMLQRVTDSQVRLPQGERTESLFSVHEGHEEEGSVTAGIYAALNFACRANESNQFESLSSEQKVEEVVVVCGSVFIMAEARTALGFREPQDSTVIAEVAGSHLKSAQVVA